MIAGAAAGTFVSGRTAPRALAVFALVGAIPDVDLAFGMHSGPTHSLTMAAVAGAVAWAITRRLRFAVAIAAAYATHTLLDWLSTDDAPPIGIMALWPFSLEYYESSMHLFLAISRRYWLVNAWLGNLRAVIREVLILGPLLWIAWWVRIRQA